MPGNAIDKQAAVDVAKIINIHALGAAASGAASGWVPGAGGSIATASAYYATVTVAGVTYINLMSSLSTEGIDVSAMSDEELKERMKNVMEEQNTKKMMKEAQGEYVKARKEGTVSGKETVELEEE